MTLVIARKHKNKISLVSDSRFNYSGLGVFDFGIKVSAIPVKIYTPYDENKNRAVAYEQKIGFAVTGSTTAAYTVKEYMSEVLTNIQYTPGYSDLSIKGIANFVLKFYAKICNELSSLFRQDGICEIILAGFCPKFQKCRAFMLSADMTDYPVRYYQQEILESDEDDMVFFGSGKAEALNVKMAFPKYSSLNILRKVIANKNISSVGGSLQYGEVASGDFIISGLMEDNPTPENPNNTNFVLWGINHDDEDFTEDDLGFLVNVGFILDVGQIYPDLG